MGEEETIYLRTSAFQADNLQQKIFVDLFKYKINVLFYLKFFLKFYYIIFFVWDTYALSIFIMSKAVIFILHGHMLRLKIYWRQKCQHLNAKALCYPNFPGILSVISILLCQ